MGKVTIVVSDVTCKRALKLFIHVDVHGVSVCRICLLSGRHVFDNFTYRIVGTCCLDILFHDVGVLHAL